MVLHRDFTSLRNAGTKEIWGPLELVLRQVKVGAGKCLEQLCCS